MADEEMLNGHNGDVLPRSVLTVVEKLEIGLVQFDVPSGPGQVIPKGPRIFVQAPQYHQHSVASASTNAKAQERLVALEWKLFTFEQ